jgi:Xaa-Pro aminopeptidase
MPSRRAIPEPYRSRLQQLRHALKREQLDGYLALNRNDQFWLTGFTGEDGGVLVRPRTVTLLTDGRFEETARQETPYARAVIRPNRGPKSFAEELTRAGVKQCGFDPRHMTVELYNGLTRSARGSKLMPVRNALTGPRQCKNPSELRQIRRAVKIAQDAFRATVADIKPGQREREIAARLVYEMTRRGADGPSFPPIVAAGPGAALPHYAPTDRKLRRGEALLIDWGARVGWYASDLTRMVYVGSIPPLIAEIHAIVLAAQEAAIARVAPGVETGAVDAAARQVIAAAGYGQQFTHGLGHGLGLDVHEGPSVRRDAKDVLEPGMVITIEPGIYLPGQGGVRIEDDVLVTAKGRSVLSKLPKALPRR